MPFFSARVPADFAGALRLDKFIASLPNGMNRSKLKGGVHLILLNGNAAKLSSKVSAGDQIDIEWEDNVPTDIAGEDIPLDIVYEDDDVTVVNKRQGMVVHPAGGNWTGTLVNALLFHWGRPPVPQATVAPVGEILARRRPGIVHRLDKDTSGLIITAKNRESEEWLHGQFCARKSLRKEYIAICTGRPPRAGGVIRTNIMRDPKDRKRFRATDDPSAGKYACTVYKCVAAYGNYSLLRVRIKTGRTHQIRVHLKSIGCPILGDPIYGTKTRGTPFEGAPLMLHSFLLSIRLPGAAEPTTFRTRVPPRFLKVMKKLRALYAKSMVVRR